MPKTVSRLLGRRSSAASHGPRARRALAERHRLARTSADASRVHVSSAPHGFATGIR